MPGGSSVDPLRRALLLSAPALVLAACAPDSRPTPDPATELNDRLAAADEAGFLRVFTPQPGAQALGRRMFATLSHGPSATIGWAEGGRIRVTWGLPEEPQVVSEAVPELVDGQLANLTASTTGTEWLHDPLGVHASARLVVAAGTTERLRRWSQRAEAALAALDAVSPPGRNWAEPVVVLVPDSLVEFAPYAGREAVRLAAVTVVPGTASSRSVRVVVNPDAPADGDEPALCHEAVHCRMRSPWLTGTPGWQVEGIAEALTALAYPAVARSNRRLAKAAVRSGMPTDLPNLTVPTARGYALAMVAVSAMVQQVGWPAVLDEAQARSSGSPEIADRLVLTWYRDALAELA